jgi:hypothetical protein
MVTQLSIFIISFFNLFIVIIFVTAKVKMLTLQEGCEWHASLRLEHTFRWNVIFKHNAKGHNQVDHQCASGKNFMETESVLQKIGFRCVSIT